MKECVCPGLPAAWVNGWLAAVGATVLDPRLRLRWTVQGAPVAVLCSDSADPVDALVASWPDRETLDDLPIAGEWRNACRLERQVTVNDFRERAMQARSASGSWTLSSTLTDLSVDRSGKVAHAPFDAAGPGSIKWLHDRVLKVHAQAGAPSPSRLHASLRGRASRVKGNGFGVRPKSAGLAGRRHGPLGGTGRRTAGILRACALPNARVGRRPEGPWQTRRATERVAQASSQP